jgi:ferric-dicitrate binding protein FerR (iron transport regulator)
VKEQNHIDILISKVITGNAGIEEQKELNELISTSEENRLLFEKSRNAWQNSLYQIPETLLNEDKYKLKTEYCKHLSGKVRTSRRRLMAYKIAALFVLPLGLATFLYLLGKTDLAEERPGQYCEITAPKGHISKCILPDSTEIWVNTGSSIIYDASTFNKNSREIKLTGEAYFEVKADEDNPFTVSSQYADIIVTGTSFNINTQSNDGSIDVVLAEGKIQLKCKAGSRPVMEMRPTQRVIYDYKNDIIDMQYVDVELFTSWRNCEIIFRDATLNDIIRELERIYDIRFHVVPEDLGELRFRGMFSYNNNLIEAVEKIKKTSGIDYYIENKEVWLKRIN